MSLVIGSAGFYKMLQAEASQEANTVQVACDDGRLATNRTHIIYLLAHESPSLLSG